VSAPKPVLPIACAWVCILLASVSLAGWLLGIDRLTSVFPGLPRLVPMTASLVVLASIAVWRQAVRGRTDAGMVPAALVTVAAAGVLACHASGRVIAPFAFASGQPYALSLSSPITSFMFLTTGLGLLCLRRSATLQWGQWVALGQLLLALLTMAGYLFRDTFLYALLPGKGTSIMTALAFVLLAAGTLELRPGDGIMVAVAGTQPGARAARRLLLSALALPVALGAAGGLALHLRAIDVGTAIALLAWGMSALFTAAVWRFALVLHRIDSARQAAEREREAALAALRAADVHKDDFMALLAHELRNPLAPIRAAAELLRLGRTADPVQLRRTADILGRQVDHMAHLVDDLLDVARARRGLIALEKVEVDMVAVVHDAVEQVRPQLAQRGHRFECDLPDVRPAVLGDRKRLVQVVANLLGNAAKYTPEGGHIRLALHAGARELELAVRDDGIGIAPELLPHVFESFTQGTRTAGRAEGGLGLGLALVKRLAELHDGDVAARSAGMGQGSEFVLVLPLRP